MKVVKRCFYRFEADIFIDVEVQWRGLWSCLQTNVLFFLITLRYAITQQCGRNGRGISVYQWAYIYKMNIVIQVYLISTTGVILLSVSSR